jgi:uncharacterized damage-inducible protein DinB
MNTLAPNHYFVQLYDYNYWANRRYLRVADGLPDELLFQNHSHSWGSVHGILLHILNAEWIWLKRWQGESPRSFPSVEEFPTVTDLSIRWDEVAKEMRSFVAAQTQESLQREVAYVSTTGVSYKLIQWQMMAHVANHGAHHRGELAAIYATMGVSHPEDDWVHYFLIQSGQRSE